MSDLAVTRTDAPPAPSARRSGVPIHELLRRLVVARLNEDWFLRKLDFALQSDSARELVTRAAAAAVNAALAARLRRPSFRAELRDLIRGVLTEILAEADLDPRPN